MGERRELDFSNFDAVNGDVEALLRTHDTVGNWNLGEILSHLSKAVRLSMRGPRGDQPVSGSTAEMDEAKRQFFTNRKIPPGRAIPSPILAPDSDISAAAGAESLKIALLKFREHSGPMSIHPFLGALSHEEWIQFHCVHCAHHLSFAVPGK